MIAVPAFDVDAIRMWAETPMPANFDRQFAMFNQLRQDIDAACDHIEILTAALLEARAQTKGFQ
jgi:hypothetical protein